MAWQNPKTDWTAADGVRDTDFNRIEGNILELHSVSAYYADHTIYVSKSGNDSSGTGASASPYLTIAKALSVMPKNLNGKVVAINVGAGTYSEAVTLRGFTGGALVITGVVGAAVSIGVLDIISSVVSVENINLTTSGVNVLADATLYTSRNLVVNNSGIVVSDCSKANLGASVSVSGATIAVRASNNSRAFLAYLSTSNVGTSLAATSGSIIAYDSLVGSASTALTVTNTGGRIYTGSGTGSGGGSIL